jgi:hypothetical protein
MKIDLLMVDTFEDSELELEKNYIYFWKKRNWKIDVYRGN